MARRRLKTAADLRRYLADCINRLEMNEITPEKARTAGYLAQHLLRAIENTELEDRLAKLEAHYVTEKANNRP